MHKNYSTSQSNPIEVLNQTKKSGALLTFKKLVFSFALLFVLASLPLTGCVEASSELWSKTFGGDGMDACTSMVQTADGGFALLGFAHSFGTGSWLIKTDAYGNMEWNKTIGGSNQGTNSFVQTLDGGFAFVGTDYNASSVEGYIPVGSLPEGYWSYVWLAKTDEYGNMEWNRTYGEVTGYYHGSALVQTTDGGYALVGNSISSDLEYEDLLLIKTDSHGNMEWSKSYGGSKKESDPKLVQTLDGGFALVSRTYSYGEGYADVWLVKTDGLGNVEWSKTYGGAGMDYPTFLIQLLDESFVIAGGTSSFGDGGEDFLLIKTDNHGNVEWNQTYGTANPDNLPSLVQTSDGGFALAGYTHTDPLADFLLVKTDSLGNILWNQTYFGGAVLGLPSLIQTADGGFVLSGGKGSFETGDYDFWLIKTESMYDETDENGAIPQFPSWIIATVAIIVIGAVAFLVYFRKIKKTSVKTEKTMPEAET